MLNWNAPWPTAPAARDDESADTTPWGMAGAFEAQARLWNQLLDVNRSLMAFYAPWLQSGQWFPNTALAPAEADTKGMQPAKTADSLPDALESQARNWNHFLDANRNFWAAFNWPVPLAPWLGTTAEEAKSAEAANDEAAPARRAARPVVKRRTAKAR